MNGKPIQYIFFALSCLIILSGGCAKPIGNLSVYTETPDKFPPRKDGEIDVIYLGAGGYIFRHGKNALMTAPSITNPSILELGFTTIKTDEKLVDQFLPPSDDVEIILVGHSHYDHLMDVSYAMKKHAKNATVYGSKTMGHIMAATEIDKSRIKTIANNNPLPFKPHEWIYNETKALRFMAIESEHAPHIAGIKLLPETPYNEDLKKPPIRARDWHEGETYAYLIDFLNSKGEVVFRVHYQDAASNYPLGAIPDSLADKERQVDLAILCVAAFNQVKGYPEGIIKQTRAKNLILGHWEDFFRGQERPVKILRGLNMNKFLNRLDAVRASDSQRYIPLPFTQMRFVVDEKN